MEKERRRKKLNRKGNNIATEYKRERERKQNKREIDIARDR